MQYIRMKAEEEFEKLNVDKIPEEYREIFRVLLKYHCIGDIVNSILLNKHCKIKSCKVFEDPHQFYWKCTNLWKSLKHIWHFEVVGTPSAHITPNIHLSYLSEYRSPYMVDRTFGFEIRNLHIICFYGTFRKGLHLNIFNGMSKVDFDYLSNHPDCLVRSKNYNNALMSPTIYD